MIRVLDARMVTAVSLGLILAACGGGGGGGGGGSAAAGGSSTPAVALSNDQMLFEKYEMQGGSASLTYALPYGGGSLLKSSHYIYASSTGQLPASPLSTGAQQQSPVLTSLNANLNLPTILPSRFLINGKIIARSATASRTVTYVGNSIRVDALADDGSTVLESIKYSNFSVTPLSGLMANSPQEFLSQYPMQLFASQNLLNAGAVWQNGAAYIKKQVALIGDTYLATDCDNAGPSLVTTATLPSPCQGVTNLGAAFPITLSPTKNHPSEAYALGDGVITNVGGVKVWVASAPRAPGISATPEYRIFFELGAFVYAGLLEKDGTQFIYSQRDGTLQNYTMSLNQAAVASIQQGLIPTPTTAGSKAGTAATISSLDVFGIGGHGINGGLSPNDLRTRYGVPANLTGRGQTIAIVDAPSSGDVQDDLNTYSQYFNLPQCNASNPCFQHIDLSVGAGTSNVDWGAEPALDVEMVHAMAPAAHIILVTAKSASDTDLFNAINYAASIPNVTAVSMSFSATPVVGIEQYADQSFLQSISNGMIFLASTGDAGNLFGYASYPAASPYVTAVGGTRINSVTAVSAIQDEVTWQFTGGGLSNYASMPSWQLAAVGPAMAASRNYMRAVPDVAAVADNSHSPVTVYYRQHWSMAGGTSASTPIWGGVVALFGEYLSNKAGSLPMLIRSTPGGFNGLLYQNRLRQGGTPALRDIVVGNNSIAAVACPLCVAGLGYDNVTGLGTPNVTNFLSFF